MRALILIVLLTASCNRRDPDKEKAIAAKKLQLAALQVRQLAFEAFPTWARNHADKNCPGSLDELKELTSEPELVDPWKHPFRMLCGADLPAGARGLAVYSLGPDGADGTADDVKSWTP